MQSNTVPDVSNAGPSLIQAGHMALLAAILLSVAPGLAAGQSAIAAAGLPALASTPSAR
jgi:hypothetical protein